MDLQHCEYTCLVRELGSEAIGFSSSRPSLPGEILSDRLIDFSFALLIGVVVGTYSSIFVASPVMKYFESRKDTLDEDTNLHENN